MKRQPRPGQFTAPTGSRHLLLPGLGYACLCLTYFIWTWCRDISDLGGDSSMYMLMARYYSPFVAHSEVLSSAVQGTIYPPLFPLILGLLGGSMLAAHVLVTAALLGSLPVLYAWLQTEGATAPIGIWTTALFALMPGTYFLALNIWTENLYLLFSLVAILAERRGGDKDNPDGSLQWIAAVAVAGATLTRAAALPLLAAYVLRLLLTRTRHWPWLMVTAGSPFLGWALWSSLHHAGVHGYANQWMGTYGGHAFAALEAQVGRESGLLGVSWVLGWLGPIARNSILLYVTGAFGIVCLLGMLRRLFRLRFDALYAVLYLALILIWPFPAEGRRLSYVLVPVLLAQGLLWIQATVRPVPAAGRAPALLLLALTLAVLPNLLLTWQRFQQPLPPALEPARHIEKFYGDDLAVAQYDAEEYSGTLNGLRDAASLVPEGQCLFATKPSTAALYSGRISYPPPPPSATEAQFDQGISRCRFAFLAPATTPSYNEPMYPESRLGQRARLLYSIKDSDNFTFATVIGIDPQ